MECFIGKRFDRLLVISKAERAVEKDGKRRMTYNCQCDCGNKIVAKRNFLADKRAKKSCGCLNQENRSKLGLKRRKREPKLATAIEIYKRSYTDGNITFEDFLILSQQNCHYCNSAPCNSYNKYIHRKNYKVSQHAIEQGTFIYNGLDRINASLGHDKDNVVPCCKMCNRCKSNLTIDEFRKWVIKIYKNWQIKKS